MQVPFVGKGAHSSSFPVVTLHAGDSRSLHPQDTQPSSFMGSSEPLGWALGWGLPLALGQREFKWRLQVWV